MNTEKSLLPITLELLRARSGQYRSIAEATGLDYQWLCKMSQGKIADPGVLKVEALHKHLVDATENRP